MFFPKMSIFGVIDFFCDKAQMECELMMSVRLVCWTPETNSNGRYLVAIYKWLATEIIRVTLKCFIII